MSRTFANPRQLFHALLDVDDPMERRALLESLAGEADAAAGIDLVEEARALLEAHEEAEAGDFFAANPRWAGAMDEGVGVDQEQMDYGEGSQVGRYKLLEKVGEGGMGVVYMAEQEEPVRRKVALKIIKLGMDTKQVVARFEAERQALAMMDNPNIAKVLDAGITETGRPYFVMELVRGIAITEFCDQRGLSVPDRLRLFIPVCLAIQHAHQKGVIHRDIKPSNILVSQNGGRHHPMVIDFGVAKAINQRLTEKTLFTRFSQMVGTPSYMSPEQAEMSIQDVDTRSDVYSLGILLYELLTGATPFPEERLRSVGYSEIQRILKEEEPMRPSTLMSQADGERLSSGARCGLEPAALMKLFRGDLDWIVLKAIDKDRVRRYQSAVALGDDVKRYLDLEPVIARPPTLGYQLQKGWRRNKVAYSAALVVVVSLIVGLTVSVWQAWLATKAQEQAEAAGERELGLRQQAEANERRQRLLAYATDMHAAYRYLQENDLEQVKLLLNRYDPALSPNAEKEDLRGYFWTHLREASRGQEAHTLPHETMVRSLAFSRDGSRLATITMSGRVRLVDTSNQAVIREFGGGLIAYGARDGSVALSPNGHLLAADQQGTLRVWDTGSGELVFEKERVSAPLCFSVDSSALVGLSEEGLQRWDVSQWSSKVFFQDETAREAFRAQALMFTPDGKHLIGVADQFSSEVWVCRWPDGVVEKKLVGLEFPRVLAAWGSLVAAGAQNGELAIWDLDKGGQEISKFKAHYNFALGLAFSPDGSLLASAGSERSIHLWDVATKTRRGYLSGHHNQVWNLRSSGEREILASASMDHSVKLWPWSTIEGVADAFIAAGNAGAVATSRTPIEAVDPERAPQTHSVDPGDDLQAVIDFAGPGDHIRFASGRYTIGRPLVVPKPLVMNGPSTGRATLEGREGLPVMIRIETHSPKPTVIKGLHIQVPANGVQVESGSFVLEDSEIVMSSPLDFQAVLLLKGKGRDGDQLDRCEVKNCHLIARDVGATPEGTPPDVDVVLVGSGSRYEEIRITDSTVVNEVPNAISNGIETRSTTAKMWVPGNEIRVEGMAVVLPNHVGQIDVRDNVIHSVQTGVIVAIDGQAANTIVGNTVTVKVADRALALG